MYASIVDIAAANATGGELNVLAVHWSLNGIALRKICQGFNCDEKAEDTTTTHGKHDEAKSVDGANILLAVIMQAIQAEQQQIQARHEEKALKIDATTKNRTTTARNGIKNCQTSGKLRRSKATHRRECKKNENVLDLWLIESLVYIRVRIGIKHEAWKVAFAGFDFIAFYVAAKINAFIRHGRGCLLLYGNYGTFFLFNLTLKDCRKQLRRFNGTFESGF
uniref:Uncharacterized protein n=1 Tax=Glossina austeni TaxID=7395 RepID=A0A1A9VNR8_GLOAU